MFLSNLARGLFGSDQTAGEAVNKAALEFNPRTLQFLLAVRPELKKAFRSDVLTWINTFAGSYVHRPNGIPTLMALHDAGVDVRRGLRLSVAYNASEYGMNRAIQEITETGVVDQGTIDRAMKSADEAGRTETVEVLKAASTQRLSV
ncbi:MAG: hypothetical protein HY370_09495 [Proteobacteria bacterium]|nr:hypothetical protein [Pseudomonadota bacterium]